MDCRVPGGAKFVQVQLCCWVAQYHRRLRDVMKADIEVNTIQEWSVFREQGLDAIVDPIIFRAGDVFMRGLSGAREVLPDSDGKAVWAALSKDLTGLTSFFDQLGLSDDLPLIDYGVAFDSALQYDVPWVAR